MPSARLHAAHNAHPPGLQPHLTQNTRHHSTVYYRLAEEPAAQNVPPACGPGRQGRQEQGADTLFFLCPPSWHA
eukprot:359236-Chlamydomonas_euryale.AAC.8